MPVGTAGTVKAMTPRGSRPPAPDRPRQYLSSDVAPGVERIATLGGLQRFMNWPHAILTDSGGFQVMSLAARAHHPETGVAFRSHLDGSLHELTPERSVEIQHLLGADITMALDECTPSPPRAMPSTPMEFTPRWAERRGAPSYQRPGHGAVRDRPGRRLPELRLAPRQG